MNVIELNNKAVPFVKCFFPTESFYSDYPSKTAEMVSTSYVKRSQRLK